MTGNPTVFLIDHDAEFRDSVRRLIAASGFVTEEFGRADDFLRDYDSDRPGCVLTELHIAGFDGLELQQRIVAINPDAAIIFVTGDATVQAAVTGMQRGAVDFIEKPVREAEFLESIRRAIAHDATNRESKARRDNAHERIAALTVREREVMDMLVAGRSVREIGDALSISPKTVQIHRAHILDKAQCPSLVALARLRLTASGELSERLEWNGQQP